MSRSRLESLLLSFPKLIPAGAQHTSLLSADGSVRYVYMPIDDLYCVLLTPPLSNILQDIDTLHLLGRIVTEMCSVGSIRGGVGESEILRNAFELLSAFDEVISLGYRERVGMTEVRAAMEMESHEERIQEIIARNKEQEAKEELKRRAKQLEMQRREALRRGQNPYGPGGCVMHFGSRGSPCDKAQLTHAAHFLVILSSSVLEWARQAALTVLMLLLHPLQFRTLADLKNVMAAFLPSAYRDASRPNPLC